MKKFLFTSTLCASVVFAASNPSNTYSYEVTPFTSGILSDSKAGLSDDNYLNAGISLAKNLDSSLINQVEISYLRSNNLGYKNQKGSTNINRAFINAVKQYALTEKISAYALVGLGYQNVTQEAYENEDSALFNYGIGLRYDLPYYGIAVKSDIRHLISIKNNQNDFMYTLGLAMPLGKRFEEEIKAKIPIVEEKIEPVILEPIKLVETVEQDDDNDGVLNSKDLCPNTPNGVIVDKNGCEIDSDKDGVVNSKDRCPNTSPGVKVNEEGCFQTINLNINFDYNSNKIKSSYNEDINSFANMLKKNKSITAVIEAHTDSVGSNSYNQTLSEKRAISVVNYLEELDIDSSRLKAIGYGETKPIASNETEEGKAQNRRVTALINQ